MRTSVFCYRKLDIKVIMYRTMMPGCIDMKGHLFYLKPEKLKKKSTNKNPALFDFEKKVEAQIQILRSAQYKPQGSKIKPSQT